MTFEKFTKLDHIRYFYSSFYLKNLYVDERLILMTVCRIQSSLHRLYLKTGILLDAAVHSNKSIYAHEFEHLRIQFADDTQFYQQLIAHQHEA